MLKSPVWMDALKNESYEMIPRRRKTTPLRQLIEKMPGAVRRLFTMHQLSVEFSWKFAWKSAHGSCVNGA